MDILVLAGGTGSRLWPRSRRTKPKQFLPLLSNRTMLQETVDRVRPLMEEGRVFVVTGSDYEELIREQLSEVPRNNVILEPSGRGTASAIGLAAIHMRRSAPDAVMAVLSADHLILRNEAFRQALQAAEVAAREGYLVTLGVKPSFANTGYGYIQCGELITEAHDHKIHRVQRFAEKPDQDTAERYLAQGNYFWNAGIFVWQTKTFLDAIGRHMPELRNQLNQVQASFGKSRYHDTLAQVWDNVENITVDYGIMERAPNVAVVPVDIGWSDVGDWHTLTTLMSDDDSANVVIGPHVEVDTKSTLIYSDSGRMIATIGLDGFLVVDTGDALLIAPRDRAQDVKKIVDQLRTEGRNDVL
ncbi:mannose-1-phosphate guanylyltransferase [Herpetosiphon llansteffanensis]|uniref:mannose-1-phosphate guanylyltransferase n=1 Tax=Herpetosiphon llansteffanensis TaxID=2094568 RepID=UPI000D7CEC89|nr:mannose-1-phosphate guanylyltransferase [Herpetosiphon llansteffanensis]